MGGREQGEDGGGREVSRGGREEGMMLGMERASVGEGGLREGGLMKGRNEAWTARGKDGGRERAEE